MKKPNKIRILQYFFTACLFIVEPFGAKVFAAEEVKKNTHYIFLIHGIGGNKDHFGSMESALLNVLYAYDDDTSYIIKYFEYDTGNDQKVPYDFAKDFARQLENDVNLNGDLEENVDISLIMHSQGGLIGSIWLFQSLNNNPEFSPQYVRQVDSFITLATPFWGAKIAQFGATLSELASHLKVDVPAPFGDQQLQEMSFGSDMIYEFRNAILDPMHKENFQYINNNIRMLNVAAVANLLDPIGVFVSGGKAYEDDGAVPLPSGRANFMATRALSNDYRADEKTFIEKTREIEIAPFVVVNAMHLSPTPELKGFDGIPQIPKRCINDAHCDHASFQTIWKHLLGRSVPEQDPMLLMNLNSFIIDVNIRIDGLDKYKIDDFNIEFFQQDGSVLDSTDIELSAFMELYSKGKVRSRKYPNQFRFYFTGNFKDLEAGNERVILVKVFADGLKTRFLETKIRTSYTTFLDIQLASED